MDTNPIPPNPPADVSPASYTYNQDLPKEGFIQKIRGSLGSLGSNKLKLIPFLLLLVGLGAGVFLSQQQQETRSRASLPQVVFKDASGMDLPLSQSGNPQTTSPTIKIQLNSPLGPPAGGGVLAAATVKSDSLIYAFRQSGSGPQLEGKVGDTFRYVGFANGQNLQWVRLYWMNVKSDPKIGSSWNFIAGKDSCAGKTTCLVEGLFTPKENGSYFVTVLTSDKDLGPCSGSPLLDGKTDKNAEPIKGWRDCGPNDRVNLKIAPVPLHADIIEGPKSFVFGQSGASYKAFANGTNLKSMSLYYAKTDSDLTQGSSWTKMVEKDCGGKTSCDIDGSVSWIKGPGSYYVSVVAVDAVLGPCSGNPKYYVVRGWSNCGDLDAMTVTVEPRDKLTPTPTLSPTPTPPIQAGPIRITLTGPDRATSGATIKYIANAAISATNGSFGLGLGANIYVVKTDADLSNVQSVISARSNESCSGKQCVVSGEFLLTNPNPRKDAFVGEPGTYYVFASANGFLGNQSLHCSGNPLADGKTDYTSGKLFPGTADCGPYDRITLTVSPAGGSTPTPTPCPGGGKPVPPGPGLPPKCPSAGGSPTPTGAAAITSTHFRIAETSIGLDTASWQPYTSHPMVIDYTFSDQSPGSKQIWVEFKASNETTSPKQAAVLELVASATPTPTQSVPTPTVAISPTLTPVPTGVSTPTPTVASALTPTPTPCPGGAKPAPSEPGGPLECPPL